MVVPIILPCLSHARNTFIFCDSLGDSGYGRFPPPRVAVANSRSCFSLRLQSSRWIIWWCGSHVGRECVLRLQGVSRLSGHQGWVLKQHLGLAVRISEAAARGRITYISTVRVS